MAQISMASFGLRAFNANGYPVSGALCYVYEAGTTTPVTTFADKNLTTPHPYPVPANSNGGFPEIYVYDGLYKVDITDDASASLPGFPKDNLNFGFSPLVVLSYGTRAQAVAAIASGALDLLAEGTTIIADGLVYQKMASSHPLYGTDPIPDMPGYFAAGVEVYPLQFGAVGDSSTDDAPSIQAMFDACSALPSLKRPAIKFPRGYTWRIGSTCTYDWRGGTGAIVKMESPIKPDPGIGDAFRIINGYGGFIEFMVREGGVTSDFSQPDAAPGDPAYDQALFIRGLRGTTIRVNGFAYKGRVFRATKALSSEFGTSRLNIEYIQTGDIYGASGSAFQCGQAWYIDTDNTFFGSIENAHPNWDLYGPVFEDTIDINIGYLEGGWRDNTGMEFRGCVSLWFDRIEVGDETNTVDLITFKPSATRRCWNISGNTIFAIAGRNNLVFEDVGIEGGTGLKRPGFTASLVTTHLASEAGIKATDVANISCTHDSHLDATHLDTTGEFSNCRIDMRYRRSTGKGVHIRPGGGDQTTISGVVEDSNTSGTPGNPALHIDTLENINARDLHVSGSDASTMVLLPAGNAFRMYGGSVSPGGSATKFGGSQPRLADGVRGYVNEARGSASILSGNPNVVVPHGMDVAPDQNRIRFQARNSDPNGSQVRPTTVGATSFVIQTISGGNVASDSLVAWDAKAGNAP